MADAAAEGTEGGCSVVAEPGPSTHAKTQRNAEFEARLANHWEAHSAVGAPIIQTSDTRNRHAVCPGCSYSAAPKTFYKRHAELFCSLYQTATEAAATVNDAKLFGSTNLSADWRNHWEVPTAADHRKLGPDICWAGWN